MDLQQFLYVAAAGRRWAQGPTGDQLEVAAPIEEALEAARRHRLLGRLARRLSESSATPLNPDLVAAIQERQASVEARGLEYVQEVVRIQQHLSSVGHRSLLIKGPSSHLISDGAVPLREFKDIDLLVSGTHRADARVIEPVLRALGYQHIAQWPCGIHEAGHFVRGEAASNFVLGGGGFKDSSFILDIHHCFPIWGGPDSPPVDLSQPGQVEIDRLATGRKIDQALVDYQLLATETQVVRTPFGELTTLNAEATALISCANLFKDDLKPHWFLPLTLRLGEIAEVLDLVRAPQFDARRFGALAEQWCATDAVSFVAHACEHYFGSAPAALADLATERPSNYLTIWSRDHYPVILNAVQPLNDFDNRIVRHRRMQDYVSTLGENVVTAGSEFPAVPSWVVGGEGFRSFTYRRGDSVLSMGLRAAWGSDSLLLELTITDESDGRDQCVLLNFGDPALEVYRPTAGVQPKLRNRADSGPDIARRVTAVWNGQGSASRLRVEIPRSALSDLALRSGEVALIAGLQAQDLSDPGRTSSAFAPVRIVHAGH